MQAQEESTPHPGDKDKVELDDDDVSVLDEADLRDPGDELGEDDFGATNILSSGSSFASDEHHLDTDEEIESSSDDDTYVGEEKQRGHDVARENSIQNVNLESRKNVVSGQSLPPRTEPISALKVPGFIPRRHPNRVLSTRTLQLNAVRDESKPSRIYGSGLDKVENGKNDVPRLNGVQAAKSPHERAGKSGGAGGRFKALRRASMTFYKTLKMPGTKSGGKTSKKMAKVPEGLPKRDEPVPTVREDVVEKSEVVAEEFLVPEKRADIQQRHKEVMDLIDDQLSTFKRVVEGTVEFPVCKSVTRRLLDALNGTCLDLLGDCAVLEERVEQLTTEVKTVEQRTNIEVSKGERMLIDAKMELAETQGMVLNTRLELANARRKAKEARNEAKKRTIAEIDLQKHRNQLNTQKREVQLLESSINDYEGNWDIT